MTHYTALIVTFILILYAKCGNTFWLPSYKVAMTKYNI